MNKPTSKMLLSLLLAAALVWGGRFLPPPQGLDAQPASQPQQQARPPAATQRPVAQQPLATNFYVQQEFNAHTASAVQYPIQGQITAAVVPHHLLAGKLIASLFATAATGEYDAVVVLATSHYKNTGRVLTTTAGWQTALGTVACEGPLVRSFMQDRIIAAKADDAALQADHAASSLLPYIAHYLPGLPVATLLMANGTSADIQRQVAKQLHAYSQNRRLLVVASIDFSHYLTPQQAEANDTVTLEAVRRFDTAALAEMDDGYLDSPEAMTVLLEYLRLQGNESIEMLEHSSSDKLLSLPMSHPAFAEGVTSYFVFAATQA